MRMNEQRIDKENASLVKHKALQMSAGPMHAVIRWK